jgi:hypothetical protein
MFQLFCRPLFFLFRLSIPPKRFSGQASLRNVALSNLHYSGVDNDREPLTLIIRKLLLDIVRDKEYCYCRNDGIQLEKNTRFIILHFEGPLDLRAPPFFGVWGSAGVFSTILLHNSDKPHTMKKYLPRKTCKSWKWTNFACVLSGATGCPENQNVWERLTRTFV